MAEEPQPRIPLETFLADVPPGVERPVSELTKQIQTGELATPSIEFFCLIGCNQWRECHSTNTHSLTAGNDRELTLMYLCGECHREVKRFYLAVCFERTPGAMRFGV